MIDLHISAYAIAPATIQSLSTAGFVRDEFANNRRCDTTAYHGTYRGAAPLPSDALWDSTCRLLLEDSTFVGGVEEEVFDDDDKATIHGAGTLQVKRLPQLALWQSGAGLRKACDVHLSIDLTRTPQRTVDIVESLGLASFDKPRGDRVSRVFSATFEDPIDGRSAFKLLLSITSRLDGVHGKIKHEATRRFLFSPLNAPGLPIVRHPEAQAWLKEVTALAYA